MNYRYKRMPLIPTNQINPTALSSAH